MKKILPILYFAAMATDVSGQITITSGDMPVVGDTLRYSTAVALGFNVNLNDIGANKVWNFDTMKPVVQKLDEYKIAILLGHVGGGLSVSAYGYKVADTFSLAGTTLPVSVTDVYTFFSVKNSPSRFVADGFGAKVSSVPLTQAYTDEDEWYFLPLAYGNKDTSDFYLKLNVPTVGTVIQQGSRTTSVDAWGTITTPYFTTPKNCIRVRSEIDEIDSVIISPLPAIGLPRKTVDYKWLVNGEHYPALWITTTVTGSTETVSNVRYRDSYRMLSVGNVRRDKINKLEVFPNPANDMLQLTIPEERQQYIVEVFDVQGKLTAHTRNESMVNTAQFPAGTYIVRVSFEDGVAYASFVKQ